MKSSIFWDKVKKAKLSLLQAVQACKTSRLPHFLDSRLTDGGEGVSLYALAAVCPQEDTWYLFLLEAESTPGP
jgi:hypothetical protein